eukprot:scaffold288_cov219-Pinguiococcus_pyrenoidosus.AAC.2
MSSSAERSIYDGRGNHGQLPRAAYRKGACLWIGLRRMRPSWHQKLLLLASIHIVRSLTTKSEVGLSPGIKKALLDFKWMTEAITDATSHPSKYQRAPRKLVAMRTSSLGCELAALLLLRHMRVIGGGGLRLRRRYEARGLGDKRCTSGRRRCLAQRGHVHRLRADRRKLDPLRGSPWHLWERVHCVWHGQSHVGHPQTKGLLALGRGSFKGAPAFPSLFRGDPRFRRSRRRSDPEHPALPDMMTA